MMKILTYYEIFVGDFFDEVWYNNVNECENSFSEIRI